MTRIILQKHTLVVEKMGDEGTSSVTAERVGRRMYCEEVKESGLSRRELYGCFYVLEQMKVKNISEDQKGKLKNSKKNEMLRDKKTGKEN